MSGNYKILIAEDELSNSILLKRVLTKVGYTIVVAKNGVEAFDIIQKEKFDVLLTDWMMPQMDGIELINKVREHIKPAPLIIMVTALVSEGAKTYSIESGADDYVAKPYDIDNIIKTIREGIERKSIIDN